MFLPIKYCNFHIYAIYQEKKRHSNNILLIINNILIFFVRISERKMLYCTTY